MLLIRVRDISRKGVRLIKNGSCTIQVATLTSKHTRGEPLKLDAPFPYWKKKFRWYNACLDRTIVRVCNENAKIIVVEGTIGAGKSAFCQALADQFEMKYFPQPTMDELYLLPSGYDLRQHDDEVRESARTYDHKNFCINPFTPKAMWFQHQMLYLKFYQYLNALCHLYNTGQGAVLERNYNSDYVFLKAMVENKFASPSFLKPYFTIKRNISTFFPKPHLIIYLDMPVPVVMERIRTRNYSYEQNSPALTPQYLASLEKFMKKDYLISARYDSEVLIYDWSDGGNVDVVVDDIENINFDIMRTDDRFDSWRIARKYLFNSRYMITNYPSYYDRYFDYPWYRIDEIFEILKGNSDWLEVKKKIPECQYDRGYNYLIGDSIFNILFASGQECHRERRYHLPIKLTED